MVDPKLAHAIEALGTRLENMHFVDGAASGASASHGRYQYLKAAPRPAAAADLRDEGLSRADALIRLEGAKIEPLLAYERSVRALIEQRGGSIYTISGVQKPRSYTSHAMMQFAYARARAPAAGATHAIGVVTPQSKTSEWWRMEWMRRESFFLPRYDDSGNMVAKGHALASASGIPCINRRLFHNARGYGSETEYDFIGYFEFAESDAEVFREVMAGLRDRSQNPEWNYVREGPEWWGRRVGRIEDVWANR